MVGEQALRGWQETEREFLENVTDIEKHKDLPNPYEPRQEKRRLNLGAIPLRFLS